MSAQVRTDPCRGAAARRLVLAMLDGDGEAGVAAASRTRGERDADPRPAAAPPATRPLVVVHGGAAAPMAWLDGCVHAAETGATVLKNGLDATTAAIASVIALEADGRFNAGVGAALKLDGDTVEMDAAVMDSVGCLGAVAGLQDVRHPVLVARAVADTAHWLLVGAGAREFAARCSLSGNHEPSARARERYAEVVSELAKFWCASPDADLPLRRFWNYELPWDEALKKWGCGTVGAVARDAEGRLAVATSTGGALPALRGRVGDTPIIGSGFFAGPRAAVAVTGIGEHIVRTLLANTVYRWIETGSALDDALRRGLALFPPDVDVGIIAVSEHESGGLCNRSMPWCQATP